MSQQGFTATTPLPPMTGPVLDFFRDGPIVLTGEAAEQFLRIVKPPQPSQEKPPQ